MLMCNSGLERGDHINVESYFESDEIKSLQHSADAV